ncbi:hypothetical protein [Streptomyces niphimycinicus]|uniref:hypothetical protein n=1 Tax=Streptomyces niphimycinicus TaxID=2842201 RepID=UPI00209AFFED|nr:hypothetical protein [Streptomyces niphimycinicus]
MRRALANHHAEPQIVAAAERARAAGSKVAMLSSSFGIDSYNPYEDKGMWRDSFDAVILSELEGVRKPSPLIYRRALEPWSSKARNAYSSTITPRTCRQPRLWEFARSTTPRTSRRRPHCSTPYSRTALRPDNTLLLLTNPVLDSLPTETEHL